MSLFSVALIGSTPIGGPIVGWLGEHFSPRFALLVGAAGALSAAAYGWSQLTTHQPVAQKAEPAPLEPAINPR